MIRLFLFTVTLSFSPISPHTSPPWVPCVFPPSHAHPCSLLRRACPSSGVPRASTNVIRTNFTTKQLDRAGERVPLQQVPDAGTEGGGRGQSGAQRGRRWRSGSRNRRMKAEENGRKLGSSVVKQHPRHPVEKGPPAPDSSPKEKGERLWDYYKTLKQIYIYRYIYIYIYGECGGPEPFSPPVAQFQERTVNKLLDSCVSNICFKRHWFDTECWDNFFLNVFSSVLVFYNLPFIGPCCVLSWNTEVLSVIVCTIYLQGIFQQLLRWFKLNKVYKNEGKKKKIVHAVFVKKKMRIRECAFSKRSKINYFKSWIAVKTFFSPSIFTSINSLTQVLLHNVTRGIFLNTWGGSQWPLHLQIPPGALNMTTNCREPGLTLDLLHKFCWDTADAGRHRNSSCVFTWFKWNTCF